MKKLLFYFVCLLFCFSCDKAMQEEASMENIPEASITPMLKNNILDKSVKQVLWNDVVFLNLCEATDVRAFMEKKFAGEISAEVEMNYNELISQLEAYGETLSIPNILSYRTAFYKEKYSQQSLQTKQGTGEKLIDCLSPEDTFYLDLIDLYQAGYHEYLNRGGCCYSNFAYSVASDGIRSTTISAGFWYFCAEYLNPMRLANMSCDEFFNNANKCINSHVIASLPLIQIVVIRVAQTQEVWNGQHSH